MSSPRQQLLDAAVDHVATHGVGELSLRALADALGTSHRMLIYHFGSKEGLLVAVSGEVERRTKAVLQRLEARPGASEAEVVREFWAHLTDPALAPLERLFFELYGQALQGRPGTEAFLDGVVDRWVGGGGARERLGLAVVRGLLLDLLATGDRDAVNAAMELFVAGFVGGSG